MRASLKIVSFTIYEIQHNSQFLTMKCCSSVLPNHQMFPCYTINLYQKEGLFYHDLHEKKVHLSLSKEI